MKYFTALTLLAAIAASRALNNASDDVEYLQYQSKFGKNPKDSADFEKRKNLFKKAKDAAKEHNSKPSKFKMGVNQFSDMTPEEKKKFLGSSAKPADADTSKKGNRNKKNRHLADMIYEVDWVGQGVMSPVKNQGSCGSCWAFVGASVLEAMEVIQGNTPQPNIVSTQQAVDCVYEQYGYGGCEGGWPESYWGYTMSDPATTEDSYPYTGIDRDEDGYLIGCNHENRVPVAQVADYEWIGWDYNSPLDPSVILQHLLNGPLAIFVNVDDDFQAYSSGVLDSTCSCLTGYFDVNHTIVLTGFKEDVEVGVSQDKCVPKNFRDGQCPSGYTDTGDANFPCCGTELQNHVRTAVWTAQNSWGEAWGEDGFVRLEAQTGNGVCGMNWGIEYILATNSAYY